MAKDSAGRKLPWFKLWPGDFMSDPVIQAMSFDKRGRFIWACMCSWQTDTPGIATDNQWRKWLGYSIDGWEANRLDFPLGPGEMGELLVQKRLLYEYQSVRIEVERRSAAGLTGAKARWGADAVAMRSQCDDDASIDGNPSEVRSQRLEESKSKPIAQPSVSLFEVFWSESPKKVGKKPCFAKWKRLVNGSEVLGSEIIAGLRRLKPTWNPGFEPNPLTFLNQERWKDEPARVSGGDNWTGAPDVTKGICDTCNRAFEVRGTWRDHDCPECKTKRPPLNVLPWSERNGAR